MNLKKIMLSRLEFNNAFPLRKRIEGAAALVRKENKKDKIVES